MKRLFAKATERRLNIIELLDDQAKSLTVDEVASALNISKTKLKKDIEYLQSNYEEFDLFVINNQVVFSFKFNINLQYLYHKILHNNLSYRLIETTFFHKDLSIQKLASIHHASESTIYRAINRLNKILSDNFGITFEKNPLSITGSETNIRLFYSQYFVERYSDYRWLLNKEDEKVIDDFLSETFKASGFPIDYGIYNNFKMITLVNLYRFKGGFFSADLSSFNKEVIREIYLKIPLDSIRAFEQRFLLKLDDHTLEQIFGNFIHPALLYKESQVEYILQSNKEWKYIKSLEFLKQTIRQLQENYNIDLPNPNSVILNVHNAYYLRNSETNAFNLLLSRKQQFVKLFHQRYPQFTQDALNTVKNYLTHISKKSLIKESDLYHILYNLLAHWEGLIEQLEKVTQRLTAVIISDFDLSHQQLIKSTLDLYFSDHLDIHLMTQYKIDWERIDRADYDLIITTFPVQPIRLTPLYCISEFPTTYDLQHLSRIVHKLSQGKKSELEAHMYYE